MFSLFYTMMYPSCRASLSLGLVKVANQGIWREYHLNTYLDSQINFSKNSNHNPVLHTSFRILKQQHRLFLIQPTTLNPSSFRPTAFRCSRTSFLVSACYNSSGAGSTFCTCWANKLAGSDASTLPWSPSFISSDFSNSAFFDQVAH